MTRRLRSDTSAAANLPIPSLSTGRCEIAARHRLTPYQQGQLDYLCGLYAVVNAARLLRADIAPLDKAQGKRLFAAGSEYLAARNALHKACTWGMELRRRLAITRHIAEQASTDAFTIKVERSGLPPSTSIETVFDWITASIAAGKPVLMFIESLPDHYTVVAGVTASSLLLFDSAGMRFIRKSHCGVGSGRHHIAPHGLLRLALEPPI